MAFLMLVLMSLHLGRSVSEMSFDDDYEMMNLRLVEEVKSASAISEHLVRCLHNICTTAPGYPKGHILRAINDKDKLNRWFGKVLNQTLEPIIGSRANQYDHMSKANTQFCWTYTPRTYRPLALRKNDLTWKWIVNVDPYFQDFTSEICRFEDDNNNDRAMIKSISPCASLNYHCQQDYHEVYLLTFDEGIIEFDKFSIPSTCHCDQCRN